MAANLEEQSFFQQPGAGGNTTVKNMQSQMGLSKMSQGGGNAPGGSSQMNQLEMENMFKETNVGKKLSDLSVQRLICIVISIIFTLPLFSLETYQTSDFYTQQQGGLSVLNEYYLLRATEVSLYASVKDSYIKSMISSSIRAPMIQLYVASTSADPVYLLNTKEITGYRTSDLEYYTAGDMVCITDNNANITLNAVLSILMTIFVCFVLVVSSIYFSKDTNELVVRPIEVMLSKVKKIAANPLEAAQMEEQEAFLKDQIQNDEVAGDSNKKL